MDNCEKGYQEVLLHDHEVLGPNPLIFWPWKLSNWSTTGLDEIFEGTVKIKKNTNTVSIPLLSRKKRAAVLICIFRGQEGELRVILTRRSMKLSSHPGDVALPGGKMDEGDADDSATALREAMEEIGLDPGLVRVVANLDPFISSNLLTVVPVVGLLARVEDFKPVLNADEVDAIFDAPLEMFLQNDGRHKCLEKEWGGWKYACHVFDLETEQGSFVVGGLTASILIQAASIIYQRSPSFDQNLQDFSQLQWTLASTK